MQMLGWLLVGMACAQLVVVVASLAWGESSFPYLASAIAASVFGFPLALGSQPDDTRIRTRDGFVVASGAWILAPLFGALPYLTTGTLDPIDALFESVAGFTTTASSVMISVENAPRSLLLWRSMTQWIGGMGVLIVAVALLPFLGIGGMQLFTTDVPRSMADAGRPRFSEAATRLFGVYLGLTVFAFLLFLLAGLAGFDALCHALTSVSTGGFSTRDGSIGSFGSTSFEWAVVVVMFLGAMSFVLHFKIATGRGREVLRDREFRYYVLVTLVASALLGWAIAETSGAGSVARPAVFHAVSMLSGTGYHTSDFERWGGFAQLVLVGLMVLGGMSGSTTGGIKSLRLLLGMRSLRDSLTRLLHPHAVPRVQYGGRAVPDEVIAAVWAFFTAYFLIVWAAAALVASTGSDLSTAVSVGFSVTANVGPALGSVGAGADFSHFPGYAKVGLSLCMVAGRLDVFTLLVLLQPRFWRG
jgi:trk system potassium uptake protein TrkH